PCSAPGGTFPVATAYILLGGGLRKIPGGLLYGGACADPPFEPLAASFSGSFMFLPGQSMNGGLNYTRSSGKQFTASSATIEITTLGVGGGAVAGKFSGTFPPVNPNDPPATLQLEATLHLCRVYDFAPP